MVTKPIINEPANKTDMPRRIDRLVLQLNDAFNAFTNPGVRNPMSANDLAVMNGIGWTNGGVIEATHVHHHV